MIVFPEDGATTDDLVTFPLTVCRLCLYGHEGECHTPGCAFFICPAPTTEQADRLWSAFYQARKATK